MTSRTIMTGTPMTTTPNPTLGRLLLTGAAGGLGKVLREKLQPYARIIRLSDIAPLAPAAGEHEEVVRSEEHTSELQSLMRISYAVFCLKKKTHNQATPP